MEKLYNKLAGEGTSPAKRSAAYILRENNADTLRQVSQTVVIELIDEVFQLENEIAQLQAKRMATSHVYCESMRKKIEEFHELGQIGTSERHPIDFGRTASRA